MQYRVIHVVAAIIVRDGRIFATQRGYGDWKDWWEFPGGKIEGTTDLDGVWLPTESPEQALQREIMEELATDVAVHDLFMIVEHDYPANAETGAAPFHLSMQCYLCTVRSGSLTLLEHESARWLLPAELHSVRWLPADEQIIEKIIRDRICIID